MNLNGQERASSTRVALQTSLRTLKKAIVLIKCGEATLRNSHWPIGGYSLVLLLALSQSAQANQEADQLPDCGAENVSPFADPKDAYPRVCPNPTPRNYVPRFAGLGYEILKAESEACFVPDASFRLLDDIVDEIKSKPEMAELKASSLTKDEAIQISQTIDNALKARNFGLHIPTMTLGDALSYRNVGSAPERHIVDCDTASMIYLTVAENLQVPMSLVDITLPSGAGHNYVRWNLADATTADWDTNGRALCRTPEGLSGNEGSAMSRNQTLGYTYRIRGDLNILLKNYAGAVADFRQSILLFPESAKALNNLAWLVATKEFPDRRSLAQESLAAARRAVSINKSANRLDTLACMQAFVGNYGEALKTESEALTIQRTRVFEQRYERFKVELDCTGQE